MPQTQRRKPVSDQTYVFNRIRKGRFRNGQREFRIEWETGERTWEPDSVFSDDMLRDINGEYTPKGTKMMYTFLNSNLLIVRFWSFIQLLYDFHDE